MLCSVFARFVLHQPVLGHKGEQGGCSLGGLLTTSKALSHLHMSSDQDAIVFLKFKYFKFHAF